MNTTPLTGTETREGVRPSTYSTETLLAAVSRMRIDDAHTRNVLIKQVTARNPSACFVVVGFLVRESKGGQ